MMFGEILTHRQQCVQPVGFRRYAATNLEKPVPSCFVPLNEFAAKPDSILARDEFGQM